MRRKLNLLVAGLALLLMISSSLFAQVTAGSVTGSVLDPNRAVIQGATVTLVNKNTGARFNAQTTGSGAFTFPNVAAGDYTITIEATGFTKLEQGVTVNLNQESSVNAVLAVGSGGANVVDVTAASEGLIQTESSTLGKTFQTELVQNLPTFGNQNSLALLSANVVGQATGTAGSGGTVGGIRPRYNIFTIDGVDNNDPSVTGPQTTVIQDAVSEFTLLQNNFNAEFGQGGGGQFVTATKSGTNEFHGSGFLYLQNQRLNAASTAEESLLNDGAISEKPRFRDTRFGGTFGGPIFKNRLFFFAAGEHRIVGQDATSTGYDAPTSVGLDRLAADSRSSPFVINLLRNNLVLPSVSNGTYTLYADGIPLVIPIGTVSTVVPAGSTDKQFQTNVDWNPSSSDQFRFRFSFDNFGAEGVGLGSPRFNNGVVFQSRLFSATYVKAFSSSVVNELRLSYRQAISDFPLVDPAANDFPNITVSDLGLGLGPDGNLPQSGADNSYQVFDALNYVVGPHTFKFGAEYRNIISASNFLPRSRGDYTYVNLEELIQDFAPTDLSGPLRGVGSGGFISSHQQYYFFGQDDWKVTPNLTLNLGLRYELVTLPRDTALQQLNAIANVPGLITFDVPKIDKNNFGPRVGFAYSPDFGGSFGRFMFGEGRTSSIRGNFGMSYAQIFQNLNLLQLPPQFQQELNLDSARALGVDDFNFLRDGGLPSTPIPPTTPLSARQNTGGHILDQRFAEIYSFTLGFQRELPGNMAMEIRYLGTRGRHLPIQARADQPIVDPATLVIPTFFTTPTAAQLAGLPTRGSRLPALGTGGTSPLIEADFFFLTEFRPVGNSQYDSGSVSVTRRFSDGLAFTTAYTFSKTLSDSDNELFTSLVNPRRLQDANNVRNEWSLSTFDVPHRFVFAANYEPSWFRGSDNAFLKTVLGGWVFAPIFQVQSGQPFTPQGGIDANYTFDSAGDRTVVNPAGTDGTGSGIRAVNSAGVTVPLTSTATVAYVALNPNARYVRAGLGARATAGRNTLRANGFHRTDLTALKDFRFGEERYNMQVGVEVFNLWNQRIRTLAGFEATSNAFARVDSANFNDYSLGNFSGRTVQLRAKFIF